MKFPVLFIFLVCVFCACGIYAWTSLPVVQDSLVFMPGTQPNQVALEAPNRCLNCHADLAKPVHIGFDWKGSMMAQAARDPIFWACFTVSLQDSVWALGNPNAGDLCLRCHFPQGWLEGRSDPTNASLMTGSDYDAIHCDFCHTMKDPFFETTYAGQRESNDWSGYWDEAGNTGPGSGTLSQTEALKTYNQDLTESPTLKLFSGQNFYSKFNIPLYSTYQESTSGQYFVSGNSAKRASFADANAKHQMFYSRFHKSKYFCATCHDVSNPALANLGLSGLPDQSGAAGDLISEQYSAGRFFHVERTFSEFMLSQYGQQGGAATTAEFQQLSGGITWAAKCQDCHMMDIVGYGCNKAGVPLRPDQSPEHPNSGKPKHDMTGGNAWISYILASLDPTVSVYDPVNAQLLNQSPTLITLNLAAGETPVNNGQLLLNGANRAKDQLHIAASIKDLSFSPQTGLLNFKLQNNTAHKLISGFPEGRRMFLNIKAWSRGSLVYHANPYAGDVGTLKGLPHSASSPALAVNEHYLDELVYEVHPKSDLTNENETFHFVLATGRYKDNRIPPRGFNISAAPDRISTPVWHGADAPDYFTAAEYAGGYDDISLTLPAGVEYLEITLYYQGTSREYVEFLRDEINGVGTTLSSPTPSGELNAYIVQTDPFFAKLKPWGNIIWNLWHHNHGLDGSGKSVEGIVPLQMTKVVWGTPPVPPESDLSGDGIVNLVDFNQFAWWWLESGCTPPNNCSGADLNPDGTIDILDLQLFVQDWLWGK